MLSETTFEHHCFRRLFSLTLYKNKKIPLGEMSFSKDFVHDTHGDLYPVLEKCGQAEETVADGLYRLTGASDASVTRLCGAFFPYATYEICLLSLEGTAGFRFIKPDGTVFEVSFGKTESGTFSVNRIDSAVFFVPGMRFFVTCRTKHADIYYCKPDGAIQFCQTLTAQNFEDIGHENVFGKTKAALFVSGSVTIKCVSFYIDCGVSQADMRPIRYENGDLLIENGRIFLSMSVRMQAECYQGIFSWVPGTSDFELCGALFFDAGDGVPANDVAVSLLFDRKRQKWLYWVCSFAHGHRLAHGECAGDVRFGISTVRVDLMPFMPENTPDTAFLAKEGDEDPDFVFDEETRQWYMTVCRPVTDADGKNRYRYFLFRSDDPFEGYECVSHALSGEETGGSFVRDGRSLAFVCGNGFAKRAEYRVYRVPDFRTFSLLKQDYDDGGFRGWGTVIPFERGSRKRYYHLTFDRHNASEYNWSYGNLYCFEATE